MSFKRNKLRDAITFALVVGSASAFGAGAAFAQETPAAETTPTEIDTINVTGTRIQSQSVTESSPVVEIQPEEFQYAGATRVDDLVNQYPQMTPYFDSFANNGATGYPTVSLRQLGPQRTLTLVNGNRLPPGSLEVRDVSIIPASLVKRVDILTGGASAVYGSDAIAGVVNFILNTEFEGVSVSAGISAYQHDNDNEYMQLQLDRREFDYPSGNSGFDGVSKNIDLAVGSSFADGAGHAMAWLTWRQNEALFQGERDYSSCALTAQGVQGTPERRAPGSSTRACGGSGTNALGNYIIYQGAFGDLAHLNPDGTIGLGFGTPYNYAPINYYQRPDERYTFGGSMKYEINEHFRPYLETMFMNRTSSIQVAESGTFFADLLLLDCSQMGSACADLGLDPTAPVYAYVGRRNIEGGPRIQKFDTNSYRFVAGVEGAINDSWSYNTSFLYGHTTQDNQGFGDFLSDRIGPAIRGCQPGDTFAGCIPYNPFIIGGITPEAAAAIEGTSFSSTKTQLKSFNAYITGDLGWAMPWADDDNISVVFGGEWREETYDFVADQDSQEGNFAGAGGPSIPLAGKISVSEMFMESAIPVYKGDGVLRAFALDLGYRLSDYNLSGKAETYKIGFTSDFGMVRARGGFNHAIRAPSTAELFSLQQIALTTAPDPCAGSDPTFTFEQCARTGVTLAQYGNILESPAGQYNQFVGGDPGLQPESADTWTLGFVITPIDNLQITLDYYQIKLEDQITAVGVRDILNACGLSNVAEYCALVHRNPNSGDLWIGNDINTSGYTINLTSNNGELDFRGIDLGVNYRWEMLGGRFSASLQGTYLLNQKVNSLPGVDLDLAADGLQSAEYDCAGLINPNCQSPEWRHIANLRYSRDWFTVNLRWRYFGSLDYLDAGVGVDGNPPLLTDALLCDKDNDPEETDGDLRFSPCIGDQTLHAQNYLDLSASAFIGKATEITVGVNNIADKEPPLVGLNEALNGNAPGGYDQAGRFFFANVTFKW